MARALDFVRPTLVTFAPVGFVSPGGVSKLRRGA